MFCLKENNPDEWEYMWDALKKAIAIQLPEEPDDWDAVFEMFGYMGPSVRPRYHCFKCRGGELSGDRWFTGGYIHVPYSDGFAPEESAEEIAAEEVPF